MERPVWWGGAAEKIACESLRLVSHADNVNGRGGATHDTRSYDTVESGEGRNIVQGGGYFIGFDPPPPTNNCTNVRLTPWKLSHPQTALPHWIETPFFLLKHMYVTRYHFFSCQTGHHPPFCHHQTCW